MLNRAPVWGGVQTAPSTLPNPGTPFDSPDFKLGFIFSFVATNQVRGAKKGEGEAGGEGKWGLLPQTGPIFKLKIIRISTSSWGHHGENIFFLQWHHFLHGFEESLNMTDTTSWPARCTESGRWNDRWGRFSLPTDPRRGLRRDMHRAHRVDILHLNSDPVTHGEHSPSRKRRAKDNKLFFLAGELGLESTSGWRRWRWCVWTEMDVHVACSISGWDCQSRVSRKAAERASGNSDGAHWLHLWNVTKVGSWMQLSTRSLNTTRLQQ